MFCPKCGSQNLDTAKFCAKCGTPLTMPTAPRQTASPAAQQPSWNQGVPAQGAPSQGMPAQGMPVRPVSSAWSNDAPTPVSTMGGGAVMSQGTGDLVRMVLGGTDALLALVLTLAPWLAIDAPWIGTYTISLPSAALQMMNSSSDLRSLTNFLGIDSSDLQAGFIALGVTFLALWLIPVATLVISALLDLSGRQGGAAGGVTLAVSSLASLVLVFAVVAYLNHELEGYVDVGRFVHVTPWVWIALVAGVLLAFAHARLIRHR